MMATNGWRGRLKLKTLSPIHVGTGERFERPEMEFDIRGDKIVRLDIEGLFRDQNVPLQDKEAFFSGRWREKERRFFRSRIGARYKLLPASGRRLGKEVREAIKLPGDRPYLPGSSVKGAIRTALAWNLFYYLKDGEKNEVLNAAGRENREKFKAAALESLLFRGGLRGDAKADALKALIVRDSAPFDHLELRLYDLYTHREGPAERDRRGPFGLEAIPPGTRLDIDLKVRGHFLDSDKDYRPSENAGDLLLNPGSVAGALQHFASRLAARERKFYKAAGLTEIAAFFEGRDLLPIGFGTGWNAKTIGTWLQHDQIRQAKIRFHRGAPPPKSRRVAIDAENKAMLPLGWAQFELVTL